MNKFMRAVSISFAAIFVIFFIFSNSTFGAPDDAFTENGKHLPWNDGEFYKLTNGYFGYKHKDPDTTYLLNFGRRIFNPANGTFAWASAQGEPVRAIGDGIVVTAVNDGAWNGGFGNYVAISHGQGYETRYDHLSDVVVDVGQTVTRGAYIGKAGQTGLSEGAHIQVSLRKNGINIPLETATFVSGKNWNLNTSPILSFDGKDGHHFESWNSAGLPFVPVISLADAPTCNAAQIFWDDVPNETEYEILRDGAVIDTLPKNSTVYFDNTVVPNQRYSYSVRSVNDWGGSSSLASDVTPPTCPGNLVNPPQAPVLSAKSDICNLVDISWEDLPDENGYTLTKDGTFFANVAADQTSYEDRIDFFTGPPETHTYSLTAHNEGGPSPVSNVVQVEVETCLTPEVLNEILPPGLGGEQLLEQWMAMNDITAFMDDPVNAFTGAYYLENSDMFVDSIGFPVDFKRSFNSNDKRIGSFGQGHRFAYDIHLMNTGGDRFAVKLGDGSADYYDYDGNEYVPLFPKTVATLKEVNGEFVYTMPDGMNYTFNEWGLVREIRDRNGNLMTFEYDSDGLITLITDTAGREYQLVYEDFRLKSITDPAGRVASYEYNEDNQLIKAVTPGGKAWDYTYDDKGRLQKVTDPRGLESVELGYDDLGLYGEIGDKVITVEHADTGKVSFEYIDNAGAITAIQTDELGNKITFIHDLAGHLIQMIDQKGQSEFYEYDTIDRVSVYTDRDSNTTGFTYDDRGNILSLIRSNGYTKSMTYNQFDAPLTITDQTGTVTFSYDANGNMTKRTDQAGNISTFTYDARGLVTASTNPLSNTIDFEYDGNGNLAQMTNPAGDATQFAHDSISRRTGVTDAAGSGVDFQYDGDSQTTGIIDSSGGNIAYSYDANGNISSMTNQVGDSSTFTYSATNKLKSRTDFEGNTWGYAYDLDDHLVSETDPRGFTTTHTYDIAGRRVQTNLPEGGVIKYKYDGRDNITELTDPNNNVTKFEYTTTNALYRTTNAKGSTMTFERDSLDRVTTITDFNGNVRTFDYDNLSRVVSEKTVLGGEIQYLYDEASNVTETIDPLGRSTLFTYNDLNQLIEVEDPAGGKITYEYDKVGNLLEMIDKNNHVTSYEYDDNDNLISLTDAENNISKFTYDPRNLLSDTIDGNGHTQSMLYDGNGRVIQKTNPKGDISKMAYDATGNLVKTVDEVGAVSTFSFDGENRMVASTGALGHVWDFTYDPAGNIVSEFDPRGNGTTYDYDALNRLVKSVNALGGAKELAYDPNGNLIQSTDENQHTTQFVYNANNQATEIINALNATSTNTFDVLGRLTSRSDFRSNVTTFEYDIMDRLKKVSDPLGNSNSYSYDAVGNLLSTSDAIGASTSYKYDSINRMVKVTRPEDVIETFVYDAVGNLIQSVDGEGGTSKFEYDPNDNPVKKTSALGFDTQFTYTANELRSQLIDANGHTTAFAYDLDRNLSQMTDPKGNKTTFFYDPNDNLIRQNDRRGFDTSYSYDALNRVTTYTDEEGFSEQYSYDAVGSLVKETNRRGFDTAYSYDELDRLIELTDAKGNSEQYQYDADGNLIQFTDRDNNPTLNSYDEVSNLIKTVDALNGVVSYQYDPVYRLTQSTNQNNQVDKYVYDDLGRLTKQINAIGGETGFTYNKRSEQTAVNNPRGFDVLSKYDADGRLIESTDQMGFSENFTYDPVGNLTKYTDRRGNSSKYSYDQNNLATQKVDALGFTESYTYDPNENLLVMKDARGNDWTYSYDPRNNLINYLMPEGQATKYKYDENENLIVNEKARGNSTTYQYDALDLLVSEVDPLGNTTGYGYDALERNILKNDANNHSTLYQYDPLSRLTKVTDALNGVNTYAYDPVANLLASTDANSNTTRYAYDPLNRLTKETNPLSNNWDYDYDPNSNLISRIDANGDKTKYEYDPNDRVSEVVYPNPDENVSRDYDPNGNITGMKDKSGDSAYVYDPLNRLSDQTDASNYKIGYEYDGNDNRTKITYPNGKEMSYDYSPNNWMVQTRDWQQLATAFAYDDNANLLAEIYPNNSQVNYEYDLNDRLTKKVNQARGEDFESYKYQYDPVDNMLVEERTYNTKRERGPVEADYNSVNYGYDALDRLVTVDDSLGKTAKYSYDPVGNRLSQENNRNFWLIDNGMGTFDSNETENISYKYNAANQLTEDTLFQYAYDKNGNRLAKGEKNGGENYVFGYDFENRMVKSLGYDNGIKPVVSGYLYDGFNRRVEKKVGSGKGKPYVEPDAPSAQVKPGNTPPNKPGQTGVKPDKPGNSTTGTGGGGTDTSNRQPDGSTWYVYDQFSFDPLAEMQHPNKELQLKRVGGRILGSEIFTPDAPEYIEGEIQQEGHANYYYTNHRNDITDVLKHDGQSLHSYNYEEYGNFYDVNVKPTDSSNFTDPHNHYLFSSKEFDEDTSLMYFGGRYYDSLTATWTSQDILRGTIDNPMSLHRYQMVNNNPLRYVDRNGYEATSNIIEKYIIDPSLKSLSNSLTFDTTVSVPEINLGPAVSTVYPYLAPYLPSIPSTTITIQNQADINFDFTDGGYNLTGSDTLAVGVVTSNNNYGAGVHGDAGLVKDSEGYHVGAGGAVHFEKNGQTIYQNAGFVGDQAVFKAFGYDSKQDYINGTMTKLDNFVGATIQKGKDERTQREAENAKKLAELANQQPKNVSLASAGKDCFTCYNVTSDLLTKLNNNYKTMSDEYTNDLLQYYKALQDAEETPWYFPTNKAGAYLATSMIYEGERASTYFAFYDYVKPGGDWDYKIEDVKRYGPTDSVPLAGVYDDRIKYDAMGNINFGYTGAAAGIPDEILKSGAGMAQIVVGTSELEWYSSYFDDPIDQIMTNVGIELYKRYGTNIDEQELKKVLEWELGQQFYMAPGTDYWDTN